MMQPFQQEQGDQGCPNLDAQGVLTGADEGLYRQVLLEGLVEKLLSAMLRTIDFLFIYMTHADQVLEDEQLVATVYEALAKRSPKSRTRGRRGTPAEVVMRLLLLKHIRNWSYAVLEREVRANLVYRDFTRVGAAKAPDAKTMGRWGLALGPEGIQKDA
jgi:Transposase domain (DUF772)